MLDQRIDKIDINDIIVIFSDIQDNQDRYYYGDTNETKLGFNHLNHHQPKKLRVAHPLRTQSRMLCPSESTASLVDSGPGYVTMSVN